MRREKYFKYLEDTSNLVLPLIKKQVEVACRDEINLKKVLLHFYQQRFGKYLLKPTLFRISYELSGGENFQDKFLPVAAAFEVLNISSYQANSAFDNKIGVTTKQEKDSQYIAAMISREISESLINQASNNINKDILIELIECVSVSNQFIYKAQHYDLNILSTDTFNRYPNYSDFLDIYLKRCFYGSGIFSGQCAFAGSICACSTTEKKESIRKFAESYGTALHILNDLADFFPAPQDSSKIYQDNFSDLINGRLTLPIYLLLKLDSPQIKNLLDGILDKKKFNSLQILEIQSLLLKYGIVEKCKKLIYTKYQEAKDQLAIFELNNSKRLMLMLLSILDSNKVYHRINKTQQYG